MDLALTSPWIGLPVFTVIMFLLFGSVFSIASVPMDWIDTFFGSLSELVSSSISHPLLSSLIADGIVAALGGVVVFIPQICILFFGISLLEDSGYLSRAVVAMDRVMRRVGLPGQAFIPMLSAHACAIPAIMSSRLIENPRDRLRTILVLPLLTCSARLPVYLMVAVYSSEMIPFSGRSSLLVDISSAYSQLSLHRFSYSSLLLKEKLHHSSLSFLRIVGQVSKWRFLPHLIVGEFFLKKLEK